MNLKHSEMGPVRQNPIQRTVRSVHMCVHCTVYNCCTQYCTPQQTWFLSYPRHNHHCSNDAYLRDGGAFCHMYSNFFAFLIQCTELSSEDWAMATDNVQKISWTLDMWFWATVTSNGSPYAAIPLSCLSVTLVYCGQTVEWIKMPLGTEVDLGPGDTVLDRNPAPPMDRGTAAPPPLFGPLCSGTVAHVCNCLALVEICQR